jgi:hypothetical protein
VLWTGGLVFVYFAMQIAIDEIVPALSSGTLSVETNSTILNRVWVGNEIYLLLLIYLLVAITLISGGTRLFLNALGKTGHR